MHQGMGLNVFNEMPMRRAVHALYECCYSVPLAADLARGRPYADHDALFRQADRVAVRPRGSLHRLDPAGLPGRRAGGRAARNPRPSSARLCDERPEVMEQLGAASKHYLDHFGFGFVMFVNGYSAQDVLAAMTDRMLNDMRDRAQGGPQRVGPDQPDPAGADARTRRRLRQLVSS